jgi:hypothetical protein
MRPVFRPDPVLPVGAMKTYEVARPLVSHWRAASCREVDCGAWLRGWQTVIDVSTRARGGRPSGAAQANYIRMHSGRKFSVEQHGDLVTFTFPPGQTCFTAHRLPVHRQPLFVVRDGDWRGNPTGRRVQFGDARGFVDDFGEHQLRVAAQKNRG